MGARDYFGNKVSLYGDSSPVAEKNICLIGDSNTQYNANAIKAYFEENFGCSFTPNGTAGATWEVRDGYASAVEKVNAMIANADEATDLCTDYNIILIMMGTNCSAVGTLADTSATTTTMCGAIRYCLEKLLYYYRKSKIGVILPPQRDEGNDGQLERNALIQQICSEYSVPTLDLNRGGQIVGDSEVGNTCHYLGDGLHFGANGVIQFEETVGRWIAYGLWKSGENDNEGKGITLTDAKVGDIARVAAVDENGVPTAWEPVDMPSGGGASWIKLGTVTLEEDVAVWNIFVEDINPKYFGFDSLSVNYHFTAAEGNTSQADGSFKVCLNTKNALNATPDVSVVPYCIRNAGTYDTAVFMYCLPGYGVTVATSSAVKFLRGGETEGNKITGVNLFGGSNGKLFGKGSTATFWGRNN